VKHIRIYYYKPGVGVFFVMTESNPSLGWCPSLISSLAAYDQLLFCVMGGTNPFLCSSNPQQLVNF